MSRIQNGLGAERAGSRSAVGALVAAALLLGASGAHAGLTSEKCLAAKEKAGGNLRKCRAYAEANLILVKVADFGKCERAFASALSKLTEKASQAGVECRFRGNGDGTIIDLDTGLQWEGKDSLDGVQNFSNPHDGDNDYSWSATGDLADGQVFTEFLGRLNGSLPPPAGADPCTSSDGVAVTGGFAGHCDWRLPTVAELATLVDQSVPGCGLASGIAGVPCIHPVFTSTIAHLFWSSTTDATDAINAWEVSFRDPTGTVLFTVTKNHQRVARAVRGGW